jgi:hypothetical protein
MPACHSHVVLHCPAASDRGGSSSSAPAAAEQETAAALTHLQHPCGRTQPCYRPPGVEPPPLQFAGHPATGAQSITSSSPDASRCPQNERASEAALGVNQGYAAASVRVRARELASQCSSRNTRSVASAWPRLRRPCRLQPFASVSLACLQLRALRPGSAKPPILQWQ